MRIENIDKGIGKIDEECQWYEEAFGIWEVVHSSYCINCCKRPKNSDDIHYTITDQGLLWWHRRKDHVAACK